MAFRTGLKALLKIGAVMAPVFDRSLHWGQVRRRTAAILLPAVGMFSGCGPYLGSSLEIPDIQFDSKVDENRTTSQGFRGSGISPASQTIAVERLIDMRQSPVIVTRGEDSTELVGDVGIKVSDAIKRLLTDKGYNVSSFGDHAVRGEVRIWRAAVDSNLTGSLESDASIYIEVFNQRQQKIFSGVFRGSAKSQTPLISSSDVSDSLGKAMGQAINELSADPAFLRALNAR